MFGIDINKILQNKNFQMILGPIIFLVVIGIIYSIYKFIVRVLLSGVQLIKSPWDCRQGATNDNVALATNQSPLTFINNDIKKSIGNNYTYCFWMNINDFNYKYGSIKHILSKGKSTMDSVNPGVWLHATEPSLIFKFDHYDRVYNQSHTGQGGGEPISVCQDWSSQYPNKHPYVPGEYPGENLEKNYCRNPGKKINGTSNNVDGNSEKENSSWCYSMRGKAQTCYRDGQTFNYEDAVSMNPPSITSDRINNHKHKHKHVKNQDNITQFLNRNDNILDDWYNSDSIVLRNIPLQKWNFIVIILEDQTVDIYFNGKLAKSLKLSSPVITGGSEANLIIGANGGFGGSMATLTIYERALTPEEVQALYMEGYSSGDSLASELAGLVPEITMPSIRFKKTKY